MNKSLRDTEEKSQEPQDEDNNDNSPKNGMKHTGYSFFDKIITRTA